MGTRKFRQKSVFRGPVYFKNISGLDLALTDDQDLRFGTSNDVVIEWDTDGTPDSLLLTPGVAGNQITIGTSTYYADLVGCVNDVDVDLYGTNPDVNINRNLIAASTNLPVVYLRQQHTSDDQAVLQIVQACAAVALDLDGALDIDGQSAYTSGSLVNIDRNLISTSTDAPVVYIRQQHTTDDQPALQVVQNCSAVGINLDGALDIDGPSAYTSGSLVDVNRNLISTSTDAPVVYIRQQHTTDDQPALQVVQAANAAAMNIDGALDIDGQSAYTSGAVVDVNRNLASSSTDTAVVYIKQDNTGDDQPCLTLVNDATAQLTLDAQGWCNVGYTTTQNTQSTVGTGSVRLINVNSKWFWQVHTGSGTYKYLEVSSSTTA